MNRYALLIWNTIPSFKHCASRNMKCCNPSEEHTEKRKRKIRDLENVTYKRREEELGTST